MTNAELNNAMVEVIDNHLSLETKALAIRIADALMPLVMRHSEAVAKDTGRYLMSRVGEALGKAKQLAEADQKGQPK